MLPEELTAPFTFDEINWRVGPVTKDKTKTKPLAYMDARNVMDRLDSVLGPENWQNRYFDAGRGAVCELSIRIDGEWITKADGAGETQIEADKGAFSDAFKRAAVRFGIGRYLYDVDCPWVKLNPKYNKEIDPAEMPRLRQIYDRMVAGSAVPAAPSESLRELSDALTEVSPDDCTKWMSDNLEQIDALSDTEKQVIKRMCSAKLSQRTSQAA